MDFLAEANKLLPEMIALAESRISTRIGVC